MDLHVYKPGLGFEFLYVGIHEYELSILATHFNMVSITCDWNNRATVEGIYILRLYYHVHSLIFIF